jgi:hypothetical protein
MKDELNIPGRLKPSNILVFTRSRESTRKVDYIYAMLPVLALTLRVEPNQLPIKPDSKKKLNDILVEATVLCMLSDGNLSILSAVQDRFFAPRNCPSWTVDFTKKKTPYPLSILLEFVQTLQQLRMIDPNTEFPEDEVFRWLVD